MNRCETKFFGSGLWPWPSDLLGALRVAAFVLLTTPILSACEVLVAERLEFPEGGVMFNETTVEFRLRLLRGDIEPWRQLPPDGLEIPVRLTNPDAVLQAVRMSDFSDLDGDGLFSAQTQVLALELRGIADFGPPFGKVEIVAIQNPVKPTFGTVQQKGKESFFPAIVSFKAFHMFFTPLGILHNEEPTFLVADGVTGIPPEDPGDTPFVMTNETPLLDQDGNIRAIMLAGGLARHASQKPISHK